MVAMLLGRLGHSPQGPGHLGNCLELRRTEKVWGHVGPTRGWGGWEPQAAS